MIAGTIKNSVKMAMMDSQVQQKKFSGTLGRKDLRKDLTPQERELAMFQEQARDIRESRERADLDAKLKSGQELTAEEIEYLRRNDPQALKEYEETRQQRKAYKEALKHCDSKEEVERLKLTKMGQFMAQAKEISNNPNIPKGAKKAQLEKILKLIACVQDEHLKFVKSLQYQQLPDKDREEDGERERKESENPDVPFGAERMPDDGEPRDAESVGRGRKTDGQEAKGADDGLKPAADIGAGKAGGPEGGDNGCDVGEFVDLRL